MKFASNCGQASKFHANFNEIWAALLRLTAAFFLLTLTAAPRSVNLNSGRWPVNLNGRAVNLYAAHERVNLNAAAVNLNAAGVPLWHMCRFGTSQSGTCAVLAPAPRPTAAGPIGSWLEFLLIHFSGPKTTFGLAKRFGYGLPHSPLVAPFFLFGGH